jgi:hypothetical protein
LVDTIIPDRKTAISVAEAILFKVYGKQTIIKEQPYSVDLIDGYWILQGDTSVLANAQGGVFLIIIKASNGLVIKLEHSE